MIDLPGIILNGHMLCISLWKLLFKNAPLWGTIVEIAFNYITDIFIPITIYSKLPYFFLNPHTTLYLTRSLLMDIQAVCLNWINKCISWAICQQCHSHWGCKNAMFSSLSPKSIRSDPHISANKINVLYWSQNCWSEKCTAVFPTVQSTLGSQEVGSVPRHGPSSVSNIPNSWTRTAGSVCSVSH